MKTKNTFTIHTELLDGKLDGARNIYMGANSTCHLYVIPREEITLANTINDISGLLATEVVNSFKSIASRDLFIKEHCKKEKGQIVLLHDVPFDSPSGASGFVLGRPSNGWDDWKDADGKKLSEIVKR